MSDSPAQVRLDRASLIDFYRSGGRARAVVATILERIATFPDPAVWISRAAPEQVLQQVDVLEKRQGAGEGMPLYGLPFAVKDNIDVAGFPTTAACPKFSRVPERSSPVVERLHQAGAIFIGKTNLDQFACGLAGDRSPHGACRNAFNPRYVSGGSSSGSAAAVAGGLVTFALGTDTAGSGRVPAGCNNIVGLKPTTGLLSSEGVVPSCRSLDCVTVLALTVDDARAVLDVALEGKWPIPNCRRQESSARVSFAVPRDEDLEFFGDGDQERLYRKAVAGLETLGWKRVVLDFRRFREVAKLLYEGPWLAERLAGMDGFFHKHRDALHPVTRRVIEGGVWYSAVEFFEAASRLQSLKEACWAAFAEADVLMVPTMPTIPTLAAVEADSEGWSRRLGYYTNFANLLQFAAIAVPAGFTPQGLPGGITLLGPGGSDRRLCELGALWQRQQQLPLGATGWPLPKTEPVPSTNGHAPAAEGRVRVAVAGAHLRGQPLHRDLLQMDAKFVRSCRTAPHYRFVALMNLQPPRPGLIREDGQGTAIAVEIYDMPFAGFGKLVASVIPPLAIGTVELDDGEAVKGFLCESFAATSARDISDYGGWVAFREKR